MPSMKDIDCCSNTNLFTKSRKKLLKHLKQINVLYCVGIVKFFFKRLLKQNK